MNPQNQQILAIACLIFLAIPTAKTHIQGVWIEEYEEPFDELMAGGQEGSDPVPTYICRAKPSGHYVPGKLIPATSKCYITTEHGDMATGNFKVLQKDTNYQWVTNNGRIPANAIEGGTNSVGDKLFICRTKRLTFQKRRWFGKAKLVGIVGVGGAYCSAAWDGKTYRYKEYELLVLKEKKKEEEEERRDLVPAI